MSHKKIKKKLVKSKKRKRVKINPLWRKPSKNSKDSKVEKLKKIAKLRRIKEAKNRKGLKKLLYKLKFKR